MGMPNYKLLPVLVRKLKREYEVRNKPENGLPAIIADRAVWKRVIKERAGIR